jgi:3-phenylpropionate/trans-cinnamate dioxygenase alpha subunit
MTRWRNQKDPGPGYERAHIVLLGEYGHVLSGPENNEENRAVQNRDESWRERPGVADMLGPVGMRAQAHPHIFPNMWITYPGFAQVSLRVPKGPTTSEIWWFTFMDKNLPAEQRAEAVRNAMRTFGPAGMLEQDDGENWGESTRGARGVISRRYPLNYQMGLGRHQIQREDGQPPYAEAQINEHAQRWYYRNWAEWMEAASWADLKANHSAVPSGRI